MAVHEDSVQHDVVVAGDNGWQREARLLQALWRERQGLPVGLHRGQPLGSKLAMPFAAEALANFITPTVRDVVRAEVPDPVKNEGKVYKAPRIYNNLLTSQALCFNLFGELQRDLVLASRVVGRLLGEPILEVTAIEFEHSPGRSDARFTADKSAFDVFVVYSCDRCRGFLGIEVKYAESLNDEAARWRRLYDEVAQAIGCFSARSLPSLRQKPLEQFWRNHLLTGSLLLDAASGFDQGMFVVLSPMGNVAVSRAVEAYGACLSNERTFKSWTLEAVLDTIRVEGGAPWVHGVRERYLG